MYLWHGTRKRKPLGMLGLQQGTTGKIDTPQGPPSRHVYQVISPPGFFHPPGPHAIFPALFAPFCL
jgi:hypothetical protein